MSFSTTVKSELARIVPKEIPPQLAELSALVRTTGAIKIVGLNKLAFSITTENTAIARKAFLLIKNCFDISVEIQINNTNGPKKSKLFHLYVQNDQGANHILDSIGIIELREGNLHLLDNIPKKLISRQESKRAYLRGAFLGCGSITDPQKLYHMEFATTDIEFGKKLAKILISYDINAKIIQRKNMQVIYIKDSDKISDALNLMGAHNALLHMESIRVNKQVRNDVNRLVNAETANINKTVDTAERQIESINYIIQKKGLDYLPENLREIALLRLENFDMSLKELGEIMDRPLGKSGVNHRLRKIEEIANDLKERSNDQ